MRIVLVANRLPIVLERENGALRTRPSSGGLASALGPAMRRYGGLWIGWPGPVEPGAPDLDPAIAEYAAGSGFAMQPVPLTPDEQTGFYQGFCNEVVWPLFHDLQSRCNFEPGYWTAYQSVTHKFADAVIPAIRDGDVIWIHDYHFMGLARRLREQGVASRVGFFLHVPFPPPDIFCKLPWRMDVLSGLLYYDVIGFQTPRDRENFADCVRRLMVGARIARRRGVLRISWRKRETSAGVFPIGIDYEDFARGAASTAVSQRVAALRAEMPNRQVILAVDRLDYTKGIPDRLRAFRLALKRWPELHRAVTLLQVVVPSRQGVPEYQDLKAEIERLVSQINGEFTQPGWVPIHHYFRSIDREELLAYYRVADVGLVTPLKDGMNLVAKEYCACQVDGNGVLILSEFAGAAVQLRRDALLVNPYDLHGVAEAIHTAVQRTPAQRRPPMRRLRRLVQREDVYWWAQRFLSACGVGDVQPTGAAP